MADSRLVARLRAQLNRGDSWLTYDLNRLFTADKLGEKELEELEARLIGADVGLEAATEIVARLRAAVRASRVRNEAELRAALREALVEQLAPVSRPLTLGRARPFVLFMVGVNGTGKTTTTGKLAARYAREGVSVLVAAADTFRAAAVEQLRAWAARAQVPVLTQEQGDPAAVVFDALQSAKAKNTELLIVDTAGRLHTQAPLMEELRKLRRVAQKLDPSAPHEVLLVVDGTTGQNALNQARLFHEAIGLTGLVVTKLDGTARGGILLALARAFGLPVRFIGIGEGVDDLLPFDAGAYADAIAGTGA